MAHVALHGVGREWEDWDVDFVKLQVALPDAADASVSESEHQALDLKLASAFFAAVEKHRAGPNKDMDVAVYGASGYSAVGFLIVSYLIEYCGLRLDAALSEYASAAPPGVYTQRHVEVRPAHSVTVDGLVRATDSLLCVVAALPQVL